MQSESADFCRLVFLRHPEPDPAFANLAVGNADATVGRRGQTQILGWLETFATIPIDAVYSAKQAQCLDAARALAAHKQIELNEEPRLDDQNMGSWQGRSWQEIVQEEGQVVHDFFSNLGEVAPPEGESQGQAVERMLSWWNELAPNGSGKTFAVVVGGAMVSGFATAMLGLRLSRSMSLNLPFGGIGVLDCFANGVRVASWNPGGMDSGWRS